MEFHDFNAIADAGGRELGATAWQHLAQERVDAFAALTGDHQWIHLDVARAAAESPFGGTIVHGALVLALVPVFAGELFRVAGAALIVNAGMARARLRAPVPVGARVRGCVTLRSAAPLAAGLLVHLDVVVEVEGQARPACTAEQMMVIYA